MMENRKGILQVIKYFLIAASAGIIQTLSFSLLEEVFHMPYWPSYLISLVLSVLWNFTFNRKYTFHATGNIAMAMGLTFLYYLAFTPLSTWAGDLLTKVGWNDYLVFAITLAVNGITEFLYQKYLVFKE